MDNNDVLSQRDDEKKDKARATRQVFGEAIKAARAERGLSIRDLEERTGVTRNTICRIEGGRLNATLDTYSALASALGLELSLS